MRGNRPAVAAVAAWVALTAGLVLGGEPPGATTPLQAAIRSLAEAGAVTYAHRPRYSPAIDDLLIGYNAAGMPVAGAALREFKTYEKVTAMMVVQAQDGAFVVRRAEIPDIALIKDDAKRQKVAAAISSVAGMTVRDAAGKDIAVDAVTGATRYQKRVYSSFNAMARAIVAEMARNPGDWERKPLPPAGP